MKKTNLFLRKRKQAISTLKVLCVMMALLPSVTLMAQTEETKTTFLSVDEVEMSVELKSLLYDLQPTAYINGAVKARTFAATTTAAVENPIVVECLPEFIGDLYGENESYANVKVIKIRITSVVDLINIDISKLTSFKSLEYVELIFEYDICGEKKSTCLGEKVETMIMEGEQPVTILYELSIPQ
ncbi:hypothetical protein LJC16_00205 [Bacteroidales bacterium OttesenSCG-928-C19]|nr:hypothetical protein [Bacteroidales bacterium OttesenSCG-928-C19]